MKLGIFTAIAASFLVSAAQATPATIAFVGDSMADGLWGAFFRMTGNQHCSPDELALIRDARNGSGLARPDHFDWNAELDGLNAKSPPALVFASIGLNDQQDLVLADKSKLKLGSDDWLAQYRKNVDAFYQHAGAGGAPVMIVGLPNLRDPKADAHATLINGVYEQEAKAEKDVDVIYVQPWTMKNDDGSFASFGPSLTGATVQIRAPDGIHFTQAGYDVLAKYLEPSLSKALGAANVHLSDACLGN